jgi:hypothetical protein
LFSRKPNKVQLTSGSRAPDEDSWLVRSPGLVFLSEVRNYSVWLMKLPEIIFAVLERAKSGALTSRPNSNANCRYIRCV